jgi:hypothetical protein
VLEGILAHAANAGKLTENDALSQDNDNADALSRP